MAGFKTEIAVIGAGPGGLTAALAAAQLGRKAIVFEKQGRYGGAFEGGKGPFGVDTLQQRRLKRVVTRTEAFKYFMDFSHWQANPALVAAYVNKAPDTIRWLEKLGCEFDSLNAYVDGGNHTWHVYDDSEYSICDRLWMAAEKLGVELVLNAAAKHIVMEHGKAAGLVLEINGEEVICEAQAVVISTGGFANSEEMVRKYTPYTLGKTVCAMARGCDGDGIRMAWEAGGSKGYMFYDAFAGLPHPTLGGPGGFCPELRPFRQPNLLFNQYGQRFTDESAMCNGAYGINVIRQQPGTYAYMIITDEVVDYYRENGFAITLPSKDPGTHQFEDWPRGFEEKMEEVIRTKESPDLFMADNLEEIAAQIDVDVAALQNTVDSYNQMCDREEDPVFHKKKEFLIPIRGTKYYCARLSANSYAALGGVNINEHAQVLDENVKPIPGLYAVGNDANTICVDSYCFEMPGHTSGFAFNTGRLAAEHIHQYLES